MKLHTLWLALMLSACASTAVSDPLPERLVDKNESVQGYRLYGTRGDGLGYLDGRKQDGKIVTLSYLSLFLGQPFIIVQPAKTWAEINIDTNDYDDATINQMLDKQQAYQIDCLNQTAINMKTKAVVPLTKMSKVEQVGAGVMCDMLLSSIGSKDAKASKP